MVCFQDGNTDIVKQRTAVLAADADTLDDKDARILRKWFGIPILP